MKMSSLEVLHEVASLLSSRLRDAARDEIRDDVVRLDDRKDQLADLADGRYGIQVGFAQSANSAEESVSGEPAKKREREQRTQEC